MIHLTTGLPGNGKSLFTIQQVKERAERENRPVFYSGIPDLRLPWTELVDARKWFDCPAGAIIVLDECQSVLPTRGQGAAVPSYVEAFSTHRHRGHDIYLISQDPMQFDHFVRRLVGVWWHLVRPFGLQYAQLWEFQRVGSLDDKDFQKLGQKRRWDFPKELFGVYRSAEVHTHKRRLPVRRLALLGVLLCAVGGAGFVAWQTVKGFASDDPLPAPGPASKAVAAAVAPFGSVSGRTDQKAPATASEFIKARIPRVHEMPESAPLYDEIRKPVTFPRVAACLQSSKGCTCYTQQGTVLVGLAEWYCASFVKVGAFDPYRAEELKLDPAKQEKAPHGAVSPGGGVPEQPALPVPGPTPSRPAELGTLRVELQPVPPPEKAQDKAPKQ